MPSSQSHMQANKLLIFSKIKSLRVFIGLTVVSLLSSCSLFNSAPRPIVTEPVELVFKASYEKTWRATQLAMAKYPLRVNNLDIGVIETDFLQGRNSWTDPDQKRGLSGGKKYRLKVRLIKGRNPSGSATKVSVYKEIVYQKNFFADSKVLPSSGLEEKTLLYRIDRELIIEKTVERVQASQSF